MRVACTHDEEYVGAYATPPTHPPTHIGLENTRDKTRATELAYDTYEYVLQVCI